MYIVIDIGGTKTRIAGSRDLETLGEPVIFSTPQKYEEALASMVEHARTIAGDDPIQAVSVGVPALLTHDKRSIFADALHIPEWLGKSLASDLEKMLGGRAFLENDAALVALGEARFGAGLGAPIVVYVTISTGLNGARIVDGVIDRTTLGFAIGSQFLSMGEQPKKWADLVSGEAIQKRFGVSPRDLGHDHPIWEELARITAFGVHNDILHWSPERVVLGGSMMNDIGISVERVRYHLEQLNGTFPMTEIVHSKLGDVGGCGEGLLC